MKKLAVIATVLLSLVAASSATASTSWRSNDFQNASHNIQCEFYSDISSGVIRCSVVSSRHAVMLNLHRAAYNVPYLGGLSGIPVLPNNTTWQSHQFTCLSTYQGMRCWTADLDHGFFINAWTVKKW